MRSRSLRCYISPWSDYVCEHLNVRKRFENSVILFILFVIGARINNRLFVKRVPVTYYTF